MRLALLDENRAAGAETAARLRRLGHGCFEFHSGETLRNALRQESFDLVMAAGVRDLSAPALLAWMRATLPAPPPIILLMPVAADAAGADAGASDTSGADAIVPTPADPALLIDTVGDVLYRHYGSRDTNDTEAFGEMIFDVPSNSVTVNGRAIVLTAKEFGLALLLFRNLGRPLSRAHIMETVWRRNPPQPTRTLDAHVSQLRKRLDLRPERGYQLTSVYGFGYLLERRGAAQR